MAGISVGSKANKVLAFLLGLRVSRALSAMQRHGFGPSDADDGWRLLRGQADLRFNQANGPVNPKVVEAVDAWENRWYEIIDASLTRNFPNVREKVMLNLSQTDGPPVLLSVQTLVSRIDALNAPEASDEDRAAYALLQKRGLNAVTMAEVKALLASAQQPGVVDVPVVANDAEANAAAEEAMWAWYLEWSTIARRAITDRAVLRALGFLPRKTKGSDEVTDDTADETPAFPAPPVQPAPVAKPA